MYDITVADSHQYILENGVVTHNTGIYYSADTIWIIGRRQDKDGDEIQGYHFIINEEKSRFVQEKAKIPITVLKDGGVQKYSGLLELAVEGGFVSQGKKGRSLGYSHIDLETGEIDPKTYYEKETGTAEFWDRYLNSPKFKSYIENKFKIMNKAETTPTLEDDEDD